MSEPSQAQIVNTLKEILVTLKEIQSKQDWFLDQCDIYANQYDQGEGNV